MRHYADGFNQDPPGGYWDLNASYAFGRWIKSKNAMSTKFKPLELLQRAQSDPARRVELVVLGPFLDENGRYWDHVEPKRTTFYNLDDPAPTFKKKRKVVRFAALPGDSSEWAQSCEILDVGEVPIRI